jgi:hypothetical protein
MVWEAPGGKAPRQRQLGARLGASHRGSASWTQDWEQGTAAAPQRPSSSQHPHARKQPQGHSTAAAAWQHGSGGMPATACTATPFLEVLERVVEAAPSASPPSETLPRALEEAQGPLAHPCTSHPSPSPCTLHQPSPPRRASALGRRQAGKGEAEAAMRNEAGRRRLWQHRYGMAEVAACLLAPATARGTSGPAIR